MGGQYLFVENGCLFGGVGDFLYQRNQDWPREPEDNKVVPRELQKFIHQDSDY